MKVITKKVISYCAIPQELTEKEWFSKYQNGCFVEVHIDDEDSPINTWFKENYPELINEESFLIEIDY